MSVLYNRIESLCKGHNVSITTMCRESGASRASLSDLKGGRKQNLSADTLNKIAGYFGTTVDYLLGRDGNAPQSTGNDILDEVDIAFYGDFKELDEDQKETVRDMVRIMRERRARQQEK